MTLTRLTLVAHAQTAASVTATFAVDDEPLDVPGARRAAAARGSLRPDQTAWCAPARRAEQTAAELGLSAVPAADLRDLDVGTWRGRRLQDLAESDVQRWLSDPAAAPHGGESVLDLLARVRGWLDATDRAEGRAVAVTHPAVVRAALVVALAAPPEIFWRVDVPPLSSTLLHGQAARWTLRHACLPLGAAVTG